MPVSSFQERKTPRPLPAVGTLSVRYQIFEITLALDKFVPLIGRLESLGRFGRFQARFFVHHIAHGRFSLFIWPPPPLSLYIPHGPPPFLSFQLYPRSF